LELAVTWRALVAAGAIALAGCNCGHGGSDGGMGGGSGGGSSGGGAGGGGGSGGGVQSGVLVGHLRAHYWELPNEIIAPDPQITADVSVLVPLADGGFETRLVTDTGDGGFSVEVPDGDVYVKVFPTNSTYIVTSQRDLDLDQVASIGREATQALSGDPVTLNVGGLQSTRAPEILVVSAATGFYGDGVPDTISGSAVTSLHDAGSTWVSTNGGYPDGTASDVSFVLQWDAVDAGHPDGGYYQAYAMIRGTSITGLSLSPDGGKVSATLAASAPTPFAFTVQGASFANRATDVSAHPVTTYMYLTVDESPWAAGLPNALPAYLGDMLSVQLDVPAGDLSWGSRYVDPFPAEWKRVMGVSMGVTQDALLPSTTLGQVFGFISDFRELTSPATFTPRISPPQLVFVDGQIGTFGGTLSTVTPVLSWGSPTLGTPQEYEVTVAHLFAVGSNTEHTYEHTLHTIERKIRLPPEVLQSGESYVFIVQASTSSDLDLSAHPFFFPIDIGSAQTLTGIWKAP
jgi:hypothetical protein